MATKDYCISGRANPIFCAVGLRFKLLSKIKGNFWGSAVSMILALYWKYPFILDRNLAKANCTENRYCTSCDTVVFAWPVTFPTQWVSEYTFPSYTRSQFSQHAVEEDLLPSMEAHVSLYDFRKRPLLTIGKTSEIKAMVAQVFWRQKYMTTATEIINYYRKG